MVTDVVMPQMGGARLAGELAVERPDMKVMFAPVMPKPRYSATARSMRPQAFCRNPSR
jgi:DNA-binding NarL/FixJ family response regulator